MHGGRSCKFGVGAEDSTSRVSSYIFATTLIFDDVAVRAVTSRRERRSRDIFHVAARMRVSSSRDP